ncbi:cutinase family protein [Mycobacteroides salmoniphilum]|uniref:Cutinase n=1 Tax=Mycobacteroides salmoniphilum TaxID=404941 RepID=A0A4R8SVN7_9MYCO|nr:cutinase family protein [Mycobacteroides salmoniphilum]TDZ98981.1 Cutinase [Mycobacteroides salmoniphilum]TEA06338.1 Cutinase [Mycobacteroides salmoniphilum]
MRTAMCRAAAAAAAFLVLFGGYGLQSPQAAHASSCADIDLSFARGTNEPAGLGDVGKLFTDAVKKRLQGAKGMSISTYGVDYPASIDFLQAGKGSDDLSKHIQKTAADCPKMKFVVGGYAQGAAVVDVLLGDTPPGTYTFTNPLPAGLEQRIVSIVLFGDPKNIRPPGVDANLTIREDLLHKVIDVCNPGDFFCDPQGGDIISHTTYAKDKLTDGAADTVVQRLVAVLGNRCLSSESAGGSAADAAASCSPSA